MGTTLKVLDRCQLRFSYSNCSRKQMKSFNRELISSEVFAICNLDPSMKSSPNLGFLDSSRINLVPLIYVEADTSMNLVAYIRLLSGCCPLKRLYLRSLEMQSFETRFARLTFLVTYHFALIICLRKSLKCLVAIILSSCSLRKLYQLWFMAITLAL